MTMNRHNRKTNGPPDYEAIGCYSNCVACLVDKKVKEELEQCAKIAESEPWPEGLAPAEVLAVSANLTYEQIIEATVKATRESIARKIRRQIEKPKCVCGGVGLGVACEPACPNYTDKKKCDLCGSEIPHDGGCVPDH